MAQTNDSKLLEKVLSKPTNELTDMEQDEIMFQADRYQIRKLLLDMETEARLAALDDCKTLLERVLLENKKKMLHASEELHKAYAIGSQFNLFALDTEDKQRKASKRLSDMEKHIANARNTIDLSEIIITKNGTEFKALAELEALKRTFEKGSSNGVSKQAQTNR